MSMNDTSPPRGPYHGARTDNSRNWLIGMIAVAVLLAVGYWTVGNLPSRSILPPQTSGQTTPATPTAPVR